MKISLQPVLYCSLKNNYKQARQNKTSASLDSQPTFTGKNKLIPFIAATSASLMILAGCAQQKSNISIAGGTGYKPNPPSYRTEEQVQMPADDNTAKIPVFETPAVSITPDQTSDNELSETEMKLEIRYHDLESIDKKLGQINSELDTAKNRLEVKQAELKKAEEKLSTYERKDPNDKPKGFQADFDIYIDISLEVKRLKSLISDLEADKEAAETKQDELIRDVIELGGHPHIAD